MCDIFKKNAERERRFRASVDNIREEERLNKKRLSAFSKDGVVAEFFKTFWEMMEITKMNELPSHLSKEENFSIGMAITKSWAVRSLIEGEE